MKYRLNDILAKRFGVGPGPIREALSRLSSTELVIALSQRGFRVAAISQADLIDIYQTRTAVESSALKLAIEKGDDQWEANILAAFHRITKFEVEHAIINRNDYKEWEKRHREFNIALISACGLQHLLRIQAQLYYLTERYRRKWLDAGIKKGPGLSYAKDQKKLMEATLARDSEKAIQLLQRHYAAAVDIIIKAIFS